MPNKVLNILVSSFKRSWLYRRARLFLINRFRLYPNLRIQLRESSPAPTSCKKFRVLIPIIETSHPVYYKLLIIAKALEMRGAEVLVLTCGSNLPGCEIKSINSKKDPCMNCRVNAKNLVPLFNVNSKAISDYIDVESTKNIEKIAFELQQNFESPCTFKGVDIFQTVNDSVIRYFYGKVPPKSSSEYASVELKYIETAVIGIEVANKIHLEWRPNVTFGFMDCYSDYMPYHKLQEQNKGHHCTINITPFDYKAVQVNQQELYKDNGRFNKWMSQRGNRPLNKTERQTLQAHIKKRVSGDSHSKKLDYFDESNSNHFLKNYDASKRNIALFSNIYWDIGVSELNGIFDGVIDWAIKTAEIVAEDKNCHLYIKPHPAEVYDSATSLKGVADFVKESFRVFPENITILYPKMKIKTYDMFEYLDLGLVYNGTLGLEMMLDGMPSVACAAAPYTNIGIANEPNSVKDYKEMILGTNELIYPQRDITELFAYFYFIKTCIPWNLTKQAYGNTFDGYSFDSLEDLQPGKDVYLDHLCDSILYPNDTVIEGWPDNENEQKIILKD